MLCFVPSSKRFDHFGIVVVSSAGCPVGVGFFLKEQVMMIMSLFYTCHVLKLYGMDDGEWVIPLEILQ